MSISLRWSVVVEQCIRSSIHAHFTPSLTHLIETEPFPCRMPSVCPDFPLQSCAFSGTNCSQGKSAISLPHGVLLPYSFSPILFLVILIISLWGHLITSLFIFFIFSFSFSAPTSFLFPVCSSRQTSHNRSHFSHFFEPENVSRSSHHCMISFSLHEKVEESRRWWGNRLTRKGMFASRLYADIIKTTNVARNPKVQNVSHVSCQMPFRKATVLEMYHWNHTCTCISMWTLTDSSDSGNIFV